MNRVAYMTLSMASQARAAIHGVMRVDCDVIPSSDLKCQHKEAKKASDTEE